MIYGPAEDSFLLKRYIKDYAAGKKVLDIGTGSGILAEEAACYADRVLAVDIDKEAVEFVKNKFAKEKKVKCVQSNLFSNVKGKFDLIIFNPPYLPEDKKEPRDSRLSTTGGKKGHEILKKFFSEVGNYINKNGKILIVFSSLTNKKAVDGIIEKQGFKFVKLDSEKLFFEELFVYLVWK